MGTLIGHVLPGLVFFLLGVWHLFNHTKLYIMQPNSYLSLPWFPISKNKYLELLLIMVATFTSITMELFGGPSRHQPLDLDGTIPTSHLHNFEHSLISMSFFVYASFAILLDKVGARFQFGLTYLLASIAFLQELILFHFHSTDHHGLEGQYHLLLQFVISTSLITTLMGIRLPKSFLISFVRSVSVLFQGLWLIIIGLMLYTPSLVPKGCSIHSDDGRKVVNCSSDEALYRGKSLINIEFSIYIIGVMIIVVSFYLGMERIYGQEVEYFSITKENGEEDYAINDAESQKVKNKFLNVEKSKFAALEVEI